MTDKSDKSEHPVVTNFRQRLNEANPNGVPRTASEGLNAVAAYLRCKFSYGDRVYIPAKPDDAFPPIIGRIAAFRADYSAAYVRYHRGYAKWEKISELQKADAE